MSEDLRAALRFLRRSPLFTLVTVASLAIGIGASTAIVGTISDVLARPLGVREPGSLASIHVPNGPLSVSWPHYLEYRDLPVFRTAVAWGEVPAAFRLADGTSARSYGVLVSPNYFDALGVQASPGRTFAPGEGTVVGESPVVVLGRRFWRTRFAADSAIVGREVTLNDRPFTVIGIAPEGFTSTYAVFAPDFFAPMSMQPVLAPQVDIVSRGNSSWLKMTARLAPGVTMPTAEAAVRTLRLRHRTEEGDAEEAAKAAREVVTLAPVGELPGEMRLAVAGLTAFLLGIVGLVLLIACANVASMLLARALARRREIAVRLALGASRRRLVRQLLAESVALSLLAGSAGVLLALWLCDALAAIEPPIALPVAIEPSLDAPTLLFGLVLSLVTGVAFGLVPALQATRPTLGTALQAGARGHAASRTRGRFVIAQVAMSLLLLFSAGLLQRATQYGRSVFPGTDPDHLHVVMLDVGSRGFSDAQAIRFDQQVLARLVASPAIRSAAIASTLPIGGNYARTSIAVDGRAIDVEPNAISPDYFATVGTAVVRGRAFTAADVGTAPRVAIVSDALARHLWPSGDALGRRVELQPGVLAEVVGVAADDPGRQRGAGPRHTLYRPFTQDAVTGNTALLVRASGDARAAVAMARQAVTDVEPALAPDAAMSMSELVGFTLLPQRAAAWVATAFGVLGALLAAIGLYGIVAFAVVERTHEIGVRMALGARAANVLALVIGQGTRLTTIGMACGLGVALPLAIALDDFLFGVSVVDPLVLAGVCAGFLLVASLASWLPARRAARIDPLVALRAD